jgi:uncharacterized membrane protein YhaH (DUF805 family)
LSERTDSIGLGHPVFANAALAITAALEIFALVFFTGALYHFARRNHDAARSWFFIGIVCTLSTFIYFSVGDQIFGDHFELLEHALFWFITLLSWIVFIHIDAIQKFESFSIGKSQLTAATLVASVTAAITLFAIFRHNHTAFWQRTGAVHAARISGNLYKVQFPFLAGSKAFENTVAKFKAEHPSLRIRYLYTAPTPLRLAESDGLIIYIQADSIK